MIGRLRGVVVAKHADRVVLDVAGVGYEVTVTPRALLELPGIGEEGVLHTHLHVREDVMALYGFVGDDERNLFRVLLGVAGIGPKVAVAILGALAPDALRQAVLSDDVDALTTVPGIGKRSAQKIMLELRPKLDLPEPALAPAAGSVAGEVRLALEGLGYQPGEIRAALAELDGGDGAGGTVEDAVRAALRLLGRRGQ